MLCVENIKVLVRVRPANDAEKSQAYRKALEVDTARSEIMYEGAKKFTFDHCCDEGSSQQHIFETVGKPLTDSCMDGYNGMHTPAIDAIP